MVRISPVVRQVLVETVFLPKFCELCSESMFHIRKVCATTIGDMCRAVGPQLAEDYLVSISPIPSNTRHQTVGWGEAV